MKVICSHPYKKVIRNIQLNEQNIVETEEYLRLYYDKIDTGYHSFSLQQVFDISFKYMSNQTGFMYLHTNQGVHTFHVKSAPDLFIREYKRLKEEKFG